ncbi:hypothetical protein QBC47DRAFT_305200 [Echria macrotheca]|uniref:HMG box domain-containing protein n=1 Tax=Echria macrotheca TaxID=438768 RepID=A0AAJ0BAN7_9PEZI|nr:hypothetical protein QBC47DRAFT_305200 [Echria macrotheca]
MTEQLETIFGELGLVQYLNAFIDQGFDTWDTILDITESDLDALGVKLGHRRKLQRRIANTRGTGPVLSLGSAPQPSIEDVKAQEPRATEPPRPDPRENPVVITKRKYRRHPKPDENAPERPPSAYVLFSNKMREELKGRNLTFTEIAKLVGENWQSLSQDAKEPYESQAQAMKDKFHSDLAEYKKTPEYRKYILYLQEFKAKHTIPSQGELSKRVKLEAGSHTRASGATHGRTSRSGSGSEDRQPSEPPTGRKPRGDSRMSIKESPYSPTPTQASHRASPEGSVRSPATASLDRQSAERSPTFSTSPREPPSLPPRQNSNWGEDQRQEHPGTQRHHLPSLSDIFESQRLSGHGHGPNEMNGLGFRRDHMSNSPGPVPGLIGSDGRPPLFRKDESGSASSGSSYSFPRTPIEGSLPIHALLASNSSHPFESNQQSYFQGVHIPTEHKSPVLLPNPNGPPMVNGASLVPLPYCQFLTCLSGYHNGPGPSHPSTANHRSTGYSAQSPHAVPPPQGKSDPRLDGMSALLKAGEIVDRRSQ